MRVPLLLLSLCAPALAQTAPLELKPLSGLETLAGLEGKAATNLSGVISFRLGDRRYLAAVTDEGTSFVIQPLEPKGEVARYDVIDLLPADAELKSFKGKRKKLEIDFEDLSFLGGATPGEGRLFLAGSASLKRKLPKHGGSAEEDLARISAVETASRKGNAHSNYVYEIGVAQRGALLEVKLLATHEIRELLLAQPLLAPFAKLPSKDNGLDVEAMETRAGSHYLGLRGPVLRGLALVVKLSLDFKRVEALFFLSLEGNGIRSLRWLETTDPARRGFYVLAGPALVDRAPFGLYRWAGKASALSSNSTLSSAGLTRLGRVSARLGRPEALFPWAGRLGVVFDGPRGGAPRELRLP